MNMRDLIPWNRSPQSLSRSHEESDPFMILHREVNRLFDDVFRSFDIAPLGNMGRLASWPNVEVVEGERDVRICAELPGLDEKNIEVLMDDGLLTIRGEKKSEVDDKERAFSERVYGRFERRIPLAWEVDEDKIEATFRNGVLTVMMPKAAQMTAKGRRIAINTTEAIKH